MSSVYSRKYDYNYVCCVHYLFMPMVELNVKLEGELRNTLGITDRSEVV